jgi:opacity protein-like surface antigen
LSSPHIGNLQQVKLMKTTPRFIAALALAGAFASTSLSAAESGPYIRLENGINSISGANLKVSGLGGSADLTFKPAYIFGGAAGYRFTEAFAAELELDYSQSKVKSLAGIDVQAADVKFKQTSLILGGVYNHKLNESVTLNLGAGAGAQFSSTNLEDGSATLGAYTVTGKAKSDAAFLAQLKTGASFALSKNISFDLGYKLRFVGSSDVVEGSITGPLSGTGTASVDSRLNHVFSAGFTFSF